MLQAIIILGHGSRSAEANSEFLHIVELLKESYEQDIVLSAYLEMAEPRLPEAIAHAISLGAQHIRIIPCLLFSGMHLKRDIPEMIDAFKVTHPDISMRVARAFGADPHIVDLLKERIAELA